MKLVEMMTGAWIYFFAKYVEECGKAELYADKKAAKKAEEYLKRLDAVGKKLENWQAASE